jgi:membrane fusion protein, copper/silver efflux system
MRNTTVAFLAFGIAVIAAAGGYGIANLRMPAAPAMTAPEKDGRQVLYWYDPMVPTQRFDEAGKSPFMNMQLVPKYADEATAESGVRIDPSLTQSLGIRLAVVQRGTLNEAVNVTGVISFNERDIAIVQTRSAGFVERTYSTAPGDVVSAGAPLADLYISEWAGAQTEFLALVRTGETELIEAARQRLRNLGMTPGLIADAERSGVARPIITITTPIAGVIQTLSVRPGMTVAAGMTLAEVNGLSTVWLNASVPEAQAGLVRIGQTASAQLTAYPGETFTGRVAAILPEAQIESRTLKVRIELPNSGARLRPGMFATVSLSSIEPRAALLVASEAVIRTGRRNLVMVASEDGRYQPAEVQLGREAQGQVEILSGLNEGEKVVASGQFLIDSEASLAGLEPRSREQVPITAAEAQKAKAADGLHETSGRVEALTPESVTLSHEPVPAIGWPAMTMSFRLENPQLARGLNVGDRVNFAFEQQGSAQIVRRIAKTGGAP